MEGNEGVAAVRLEKWPFPLWSEQNIFSSSWSHTLVCVCVTHIIFLVPSLLSLLGNSESFKTWCRYHVIGPRQGYLFLPYLTQSCIFPVKTLITPSVWGLFPLVFPTRLWNPPVLEWSVTHDPNSSIQSDALPIIMPGAGGPYKSPCKTSFSSGVLVLTLHGIMERIPARGTKKYFWI